MILLGKRNKPGDTFFIICISGVFSHGDGFAEIAASPEEQYQQNGTHQKLPDMGHAAIMMLLEPVTFLHILGYGPRQPVTGPICFGPQKLYGQPYEHSTPVVIQSPDDEYTRISEYKGPIFI